MKNILLAVWMVISVVGHAAELRPPREPGAGLLYYAKADFASAGNSAVIANPAICGALFQVIWSEVEKSDGQCDWRELDRWLKPWVEAKKKFAVRFMWSSSGYWPKAYYKTPTPKWVWQKGAVCALHKESGTEIPLIWDPVYQKYAWRFLEQFAQRYGGNPNLLFVDVTPGAETNPYRFGTISRRSPAFKTEFSKIKTSDGRCYSEELWQATLRTWVDAAAQRFKQTPLLVTLNVGGLEDTDHSVAIGDYCVSKGFLVGQNGLSGQSYQSAEHGRAAAFLRWSQQTKLFFEMGQSSGGDADAFMNIMRAAERVHCHYLNVYPEDVLRGTRGQPSFDPTFEAALKYGQAALTQPRARAEKQKGKP